MVKQYITRAVALGSVVVASASHAAIDVGAAATQITTDGGAAISTIGSAMIGLAAVAVVFKWAKAAIFG
ncbi:major capsid protein [Vibrio cholerae]|uniref:major capsid protein n=1 Tax=Vibrio cholerae TaxID=666 RepID=UPI000E0ACD34|nr:major capsid protein [Vibrio cholerae]